MENADVPDEHATSPPLSDEEVEEELAELEDLEEPK